MTAGGVEPRPYVWQDDFYINVIPRSEATWESVFPYDRGRCGGDYGLPHQCAYRFAMTGFLGVRCKRVVGDADPYEVGKNPVGRGLCAPPLGAQSMSGGGTHGCRPTGTLLRSLKGQGEGTPPYGGRARRCGAWGEYGLPHR